MKNIINIVVVVGLCLLLLSCDKFLDKAPSKSSSVVPSTTDHLEFLLNSYSSFYTEGNRTAIYSTDDYGIDMGLDNAKKTIYSLTAIQFATWDIENLPFDGREGYWSGEYRKIFNANMVLSYLDKVSGSDAVKSKLKAEANFIKAYSLFQLATTYCLPYNESTKDEMGLVLKATVSFEESVERATLEQTYQYIESCLEEALKIDRPLEIVNNKYRSWRASKPAVYAFAARYWLVRGDYKRAIDYSNEALKDHSVMIDYNTDMRYSANDYPITINAGLPNEQMVVVKFPYTYDNQSDPTDMMEWKELYYFRMLYHESWWYVPSEELMNLYNKEYDLRYKYHYVQEYSYIQGSVVKPAYKYPGYIFFFKDRIPYGPTVAEMILVKAEALARTGKTQEAIDVVNILRAKRIDSSAPENIRNISASSQEDAVKKILEERRRELPFTQRWSDIRRYNNNETSYDDVSLQKTFYPYNNSVVLRDEPLKTYKIEKGSRRFAAPIPYTDLQSSSGVIIQNKY